MRLIGLVLLAAVAVPAAALQDGPAADGRYVDAGDGVRLFIREEGRGEPIVVLHGGPGAGADDLAPGLAPLTQQHRVVFVDQRGTGRSSPADGVTASQLVEDLETIRRDLALERLTLLGHSWGAGLAALYATTHPDRVQRLVLVGPMPPRAAWMQAAGVARGVPLDDSVRASLGDFDWRNRLASIAVPTLIVHGEQDPVPLDAAREWRGAIETSRLLIVRGAGRRPHEERPSTVFPAVDLFLAGRWPPDAE